MDGWTNERNWLVFVLCILNILKVCLDPANTHWQLSLENCVDIYDLYYNH